MEKGEFVEKCGEVLALAKPHLVSCEYALGEALNLDKIKKLNGCQYLADDEFVVVTCQNGCQYYLMVTSNSLNAIALEIFSKMAHK
jgi:hypothetical protein